MRKQDASIILTKVVVDPDVTDSAGDAVSFPVTVTCTVPEIAPIVITTSIAADGTPTVIDDLPVGATCVIVETDSDGAVVSYSVEDGTVVTIGEPIDVTITNTFPGTSVAKEVIGSPVRNADGTYTITYDVTVTNTGTIAAQYTVEDELQFGLGLVVDDAEIVDSPPGVVLSATWNGLTDLVIAENVDIAASQIHVYRVEVTATVPTTVTTTARDCELAETEEGTGFLNSATVTTEFGETTATDCAEVPEEPVASLTNTGLNLTGTIGLILGLFLMGGAALGISRRRARG